MDENQAILQFHHSLEVLEAWRYMLCVDSILIGLRHPACHLVDHQSHGTFFRMGHDQMITEEKFTFCQTKPGPDVKYRHNPPTDIDRAQDDLRRLGQRSDFDDANNLLHGGKAQGILLFIKTEHDELPRLAFTKADRRWRYSFHSSPGMHD